MPSLWKGIFYRTYNYIMNIRARANSLELQKNSNIAKIIKHFQALFAYLMRNLEHLFNYRNLKLFVWTMN